MNKRIKYGIGLSLFAICAIGTFFFLFPLADPVSPNMSPPILSTSPNAVFAVIGDFGRAGTPEADVANLVKSWQPDFVVTVGDNNYARLNMLTFNKNIGQYYSEFISSNQIQVENSVKLNSFFPALGNHDWNSIVCILSSCRGEYFRYFSLPGNERYYDFIWGSVHFFVLDSDPREPDGVSPDSVQGQWLKERLMASTSPWNVVVTHHPPYSSGKNHGSTEYMQWPFKEWGADVILAGHEHDYERLNVDDLPYIVNGSGGKSLYNFSAPIPGSQVRFNQDYGALLVKSTSQTLVFEFYTRTGELVDQFTLISE